MSLTEQESNLHYTAHTNNMHEMRHYWYAFLCTPEYSDCPYDDWTMYCMGQEL